MTCDEYRANIRDTDPRTCTRAFRASMIRHAKDCKVCWAFQEADFHSRPIEQQLAVMAEYMRFGPQMHAVDEADPEFMETIGNRPAAEPEGRF